MQKTWSVARRLSKAEEASGQITWISCLFDVLMSEKLDLGNKQGAAGSVGRATPPSLKRNVVRVCTLATPQEVFYELLLQCGVLCFPKHEPRSSSMRRSSGCERKSALRRQSREAHSALPAPIVNTGKSGEIMRTSR